MFAEIVATEFTFSETRYAQKKISASRAKWSVTDPSMLS